MSNPNTPSDSQAAKKPAAQGSDGKIAATMNQAKLYDAGFHTVNWQLGGQSQALSAIDLKGLLDSPEAAELIPRLPAQFLYLAIKEQRLESHHQLLAHVSQEQFTALLDFDVWQGDRVDTTKMSVWLAQIARLGPKELLQKFGDLEEEYQLAYVLGRVELYTEDDLDGIPEEIEQQLIAMPDHKLFYRVKNASDDEVEVVKSVVDAALIHHPEYAYSLLNHGAFMPPEETEHQLLQFRTARMEEHGFVSFGESLQLLNTKGLGDYFDHCQKTYSGQSAESDHGGAAVKSQSLTPFLAEVTAAMYHSEGWQPSDIFAWHQRLLWLVNGLSTANRVACYDLKGLKKTMMQVKGVLGLSLDALSHGDVPMALGILKEENVKTLFRYGLAMIEPIQTSLWRVLAQNTSFDPEGKLAKLRAKGQTGVFLQQLEAITGSWFDFEDSKTLLGFFNKIPMVKIAFGDKLSFEPAASINHLYLMVKDATLLALRFRYCTAISRHAKADDYLSYRKLIHTGLARIILAHGEHIGKPLTRGEFDLLSGITGEERLVRLKANLKQYLDALEGDVHLAESVYPLAEQDAEDALLAIWQPVAAEDLAPADFWLESAD